MMLTRAKGIDIIFNFLSGEALEAALRTLADHGKMFNFSKSDMKTHRNLGNTTLTVKMLLVNVLICTQQCIPT